MDHSEKVHRALADCADQLDHLNQNFPNLVTSSSLEGVEHWNACTIKIQDHSKTDSADENLHEIRKIAQQLIKVENFEDVLTILKVKHEVEISLAQLVELIGKEPYLDVLRKEATTMLEKGLSYEEISISWNDLGRPALGAPEWEAKTVSLIVE